MNEKLLEQLLELGKTKNVSVTIALQKDDDDKEIIKVREISISQPANIEEIISSTLIKLTPMLDSFIEKLSTIKKEAQ